MALEVGIVGLPNSGKTTLFNALTRAGAQVTAYADVTQKPNLGMAVLADDRVERLAEALLAVLDGFSQDSDPAADLETLLLELIVSDREHVERRLERVRKEAK